ncbi:MAG: InlB B-repeat-containing protein [Clostridiales Family XIII bacterium]|nr:InlB B-repeat-containing protein [Clostridiales Family XIII bacterium]
MNKVIASGTYEFDWDNRKMYDPTLNADDLTKNLGDYFYGPLASGPYYEGVSAYSGHSNKLFAQNFHAVGLGTYNGSVGETAGNVPFDGGYLLNRIGKFSQTFLATDNTDGLTAEKTRYVTVLTAAEPSLGITYGTGSNVYDGNWTNQNLRATVTPNGIVGSFNNAVYDASGYKVGNATSAIKDYTTETSGTTLGGVLLAADGTELSGRTPERTIKIDKTKPTVAGTASLSNGTKIIVTPTTLSDALSGLNSSKTRYMARPASDPAPTSATGGDWGASATIDMTGKPGGEYNAYILAVDNAGNFSIATASGGPFEIYAPTITAEFAAGAVGADGVSSIAGNPYTSEMWTNQPVQAEISSTKGGVYYIALYEDGAYKSDNAGGGISGSAGSPYRPTAYSAETPGISLSGCLVSNDAQHTPLSSQTDTPIVVKIDKTPPSPGAIVSDPSTGVITDDSKDEASPVGANSGVNGSLTKYLVLPHGSASPDTEDKTKYTYTAIPNLGKYDIYAWATDNAGNEAHGLAIDGAIRTDSAQKPAVSGKVNGAAHASGVYTNQSVTAAVTEGTIDADSNGYLALKDAGGNLLTQGIHLAFPGSNSHTFVNDAETTGTAVYGVLMEYSTGGGGELSGHSDPYIVKIDLTSPAGIVTYNAGTPDWGFTDVSTDADSPTANSGVDWGKTVVAVVPAGSPEPSAASYVSINAATAEVPDTGYYDVWVIATDIAGNKSAPSKALAYIARNPKDAINAKDFAWDIASGPAGLDDGMAIMLGHVTGSEYKAADPSTWTPYAAPDFLVDQTELAAIHAAINAGQTGKRLPLTFSTPAGPCQESTTIQVTLFDNGPNPGPDPNTGVTNELIYANDFAWGISTGLLGDATAKAASRVTAYNTSGDAISASLLDVDAGELTDINTAIAAGQRDTVWPLTFRTPDSTKTTVNVTLYDNGPTDPPVPGAEHIVGNDFGWGISSGPIDVAAAGILANVKATSGAGGNLDMSHVTVAAIDLVTINVAVSEGLRGSSHPLTFTTDGLSGAPASVTVQVTLYDEGPVTPPAIGAEYIVGNNFTWSVLDGALDDGKVKQHSAALATGADGFLMDLGKVGLDSTQLAAINTAIAARNAGAVLPLTLTTDGSTGDPASVAIRVTLTDRYTILYDGNGNTGGAALMDGQSPYLNGSTVTVLGPGSLTRANYTFTGWAATPSGGVQYTPGQTFNIMGSVTLYAVWSENAKYTLSYNGNGNTGGAAPAGGVYYTGSAVAVQGQGSLARAGYTFTGWATGSGGSVVYTPGSTLNITGNITLYAAWQKNAEEPAATDPPVTPANPPTTPPSNTTNKTTSGGDTFTGGNQSFTNTTVNNAAPAQIPGYEESLTRNDDGAAAPSDATGNQSGIPLADIESDEIPSAGGLFSNMAWALVNLALALIGLALLAIMIVRALLRKKREDEDGDDEYAYTDDEPETQRRNAWLATAVIMGIAGIILFLMTEDMSKIMVLMDGWTIVNAAILAVEIIGMALAFKTGKESEDESGPMGTETL